MAGVGAQCFAFEREVLWYPTDYSVPVSRYTSQAWMRDQERYVVGGFTHVLVEAMRPVLGPLYAGDASGEIPVLLERGVSVALLCHGSDVRRPSRHAQLYEWSPFADRQWDQVGHLEKQALRLGRAVRAFGQAGGVVYVSTPDLLDDVPEAAWLPVAVDLEAWASDSPLMQKDVPIVVHAPSNNRIKGTEDVDRALVPLHARGLIDYRRIQGVRPEDMPEVYRHADVVIDQLRLGSYGAAACEAMAAGRVVVGHVAQRVRQRIGTDLPIVEATPATLRDVVSELIDDRAGSVEVARRGLQYVRCVHGGLESAAALAPWLAEVAAPGSSVSPGLPRDAAARQDLHRRPHVVLVAGNSIWPDVRVLKYAATLLNMGLRVTALGVVPAGDRASDQFHGTLRVVLQPLPVEVSDTEARDSGDGGWRSQAPELLRLEEAFSEPLENLRPQVVHVQDIFGLGAAIRYSANTQADHRPAVLYDAHEDVGGVSTISPEQRAGYLAYESELIGRCDEVITVSPGLASRLKERHHLSRPPRVVLNAPVEDDDPSVPVGDVRSMTGLPADAPLLVYGGGISSGRGLGTVVDALPMLEGVHFVVVARRRSVLIEDLMARAASLGVDDRVHWAPYATPEYVTRYLSTADVGIVPLERGPNHDIALTNKFCEYIRAGLPIVTSDTPTQADLVRRLGIGAVFSAGDSQDLARAVQEVLAQHEQLRLHVRSNQDMRDQFSWAAQAAVVRDVYRAVLEQRYAMPSHADPRAIKRLPRPLPQRRA